jgi:hypothetical protein
MSSNRGCVKLMKKIVFKVLLLVVLISGSVYQTGLLWFEDVSDRNFFYNFIDGENPSNNSISDKDSIIITPSVLALYLGDSHKEYTVVKRTSKEYDNIYGEAIKLLKDIFDKGTYDNEVALQEELWEKRSILINLSFPITKEVLTNNLNSKKISSEIKLVKEIYIRPASLSDEYIKVYLIEDSTNKIYTFKLNKNSAMDINSSINEHIGKFETKDTPNYISTLKDGISYFDNNVLLPLPSSNLMYKDSIHFEVPYISEGDFEDELDQYINGFFVNIATKWKIKKEDEVRYGDESIFMKYDNKGIIEYNLIVNRNNGNQDVYNAYKKATSFLEKDSNLSGQEYYLENYIVDDSSITFYYSYGYDDFPLILSKDMNRYYGMKYPMMVQVSNNKVIYYKRILLLQQEYLQQRQQFNGKFELAIDDFIKNKHIDKDKISNMYLGYYWPKNKDDASLKWVIQYNNKNYIIDIGQEEE